MSRKKQFHYHAYILRIWQERPASSLTGQPEMWRFSLEDTSTGQRYGFKDINSLFAFLKAKSEGHSLQKVSPHST